MKSIPCNKEPVKQRVNGSVHQSCEILQEESFEITTLIFSFTFLTNSGKPLSLIFHLVGIRNDGSRY